MKSSSDINFTSSEKPTEGLEEQDVDEQLINGLKWTCKYFTRYETHHFLKFGFEWNTKEDVDGYKGELTGYWKNSEGYLAPSWSQLTLTNASKSVEVRIATEKKPQKARFVKYRIELKPVKSEIGILAEKFTASDRTDIVLIVEGKKIHATKAILSYHSEYFNKLFNGDFKERLLAEIPIADVKYVDFGRLLSIISPDPIFADDDNAEQLLQLADRFAIPAVTRHVEHFLLFHSEFANRSGSVYYLDKLLKISTRFNLKNVTSFVEKRLLNIPHHQQNLMEKIKIADQYQLTDTLTKMIETISGKAEMKAIKGDWQFASLSDSTQFLIYKQFASCV